MARRAVIVGAGLAGLTTAEHLLAGGWEVVVLEASPRVGGRTLTRRDVFAAGQYAEAGAEWIDTAHVRIHGLVQRFGLTLDPQLTTWTTIRRWLHRSDRLLGPDQLAALEPNLLARLDRLDDEVAAVAAGIDDPAAPEMHPAAAHHDDRSVADLLDAIHPGELARLFVNRNMQGEFAAEPREVSVLFLAQQRALARQHQEAYGEVHAQRLLGGIDALATAMAAAMPSGTVRRGERVLAVRTDDRGVEVRTSRDRHEADAVVLSCSLIALRAVHVAPPLPSALAAAIAGLGYGTVTKTALQYPARRWTAGYATTEGVAQRVYEPTAGTGGEHGILMAYTGGDAGRTLAALPEAERLDAIEAGQRQMYPELPARLGGFSQAWSADPLFGGSYAVYRPGEICRFWRVLREPHGRLHLAGEHTATCTGYLEGAVESGETVAARLLAGAD